MPVKIKPSYGFKICGKCSHCKPLIDYNKDSYKNDGHSTICRTCSSESIKASYPKRFQKIRAYQKEWAKLNGHIAAAQRAERRASLSNATPKWLTVEHRQQIADIYKSAKSMMEFHEEIYHVDHIEPLRGKTCCGLHVPWNLQILPAKENLSKHNKLLTI